MSDENPPPSDPPPSEPATDPEQLALPPQPGSPQGSTPWEDQGRLGIATAFVETTRQVLTTPTAFFRGMAPSGGIGASLAYGVLVGLVGVVASSLYLFVFKASLGPALRSFDEQEVVTRLFPAVGGGLALAGQILFAPFGLVIRMFVAAGVVHVVLLLMGGAKGFETTLRVMAYGEAPAILCIVPICGELASFPYRAVVIIIGLSEAHGVSRGAAALAVLLPLGLTCCCCAGVLGLAGYFFTQAVGR
jgi:hypothetical protein